MSTQEAGRNLPFIRIQPSRGWVNLQLAELWEYRELLYFLIWRDVKVRYKQTALGSAWAILQPLLTMVVFTLFFGDLAKVSSDGLPYSIFCYTALIPWQFFSNGLTQSSNSLVGSAQLIRKVYFPRLAVPIGTVLSGVVDFALSFTVLIGLMVFYKIYPNSHIIWLLPLFLLALIVSLGTSLWLSALNVQFRDVRYIVPFITQFWMFATPIAYPASNVPEKWRALYGLNPMVGVVEGFRWALLGAQTTIGPIVLVSVLASIAILVGGAFYFRRMEKTFADVL